MAKTTDENQAQNEKLLALQAAMAKIEKEFGRGSIMRMGDQSIENVEVISTGSLSLDAALGVGGYPRGPKGYTVWQELENYNRNLRSRIIR